LRASGAWHIAIDTSSLENKENNIESEMRERDENLPEISKSMIDVVYVQKQTRQ
jgi:hypothetical protein